jgi:hypothetical protein
LDGGTLSTTHGVGTISDGIILDGTTGETIGAM